MKKKYAIHSFLQLTLFKKRLAALFIFACMAVNGFMPSTIEVSKYSLVMVIATATQNAVSKVFTKCNDSLMFVSNKVSLEIFDFLFAKSFGSTMQRDMGTRKDNTADNEAFVIKQAVIKENKIIKEDIKNNFVNFFISTAKLFALYHNYKIPDGSTTAPFILFFLFFMISIVRKKEYEQSITKNLNIVWKARISA